MEVSAITSTQQRAIEKSLKLFRKIVTRTKKKSNRDNRLKTLTRILGQI